MEKKTYTVTITESDGNPEYMILDERMKQGIEATGIFMVLFNDDGAATEMVAGVSNMDLAEFIAGGAGEAGYIIRQAVAIAEGLKKAKEIREEHRKKRSRDIGLFEQIIGNFEREE